MYQKQLTQTSVIMAGGHLLKVAKERTELCLQVCVLDHRVAEWPAGGGKKPDGAEMQKENTRLIHLL